MPRIGGRYYDDDEYADLREEARREECEDDLDEHGWTCEDCGNVWDPGHVPATRSQPAEVRRDSCPSCGGEPITDEHGHPVEGR